MVGRGLWHKWYAFTRDNPIEAFVPRRIPEVVTYLEIIAIAAGPPDFPDHYVLHPWRIEVTKPERPWLQPGPYMMAPTLSEARKLLPARAQRLEAVELVSLYREAYLL